MTVRTLMLFIYWLLYFTPIIVSRLSPALGRFCVVIRFCILLYLILKYSNWKNKVCFKNKNLNFYIYLFVFMIWNTVCVLIGSPHSVFQYLKECIYIIELFIVFHLTIERNGVKDIKSLYYVSSTYVLMNFLSMIIFPNGIFYSSIGSSVSRAQWLFGSKNNIPIYMIIFISVILMYRDNKNKIVTSIFMFMSSYSIIFAGANSTGFMQGSSTGIVAIVFLILSYILVFIFKKSKLIKMLTPKFSALFIIITNGLVLGGTTIPILVNFITKVLNKTMTYTGRTAIWNATISKIIESPIIGYGASNNMAVTGFGNLLTTYTYNFILNFMLSYGIVSVIILFWGLINIRMNYDRYSQVLLIGFMSISLIGLMNEISLAHVLLFPLLIVSLSNFAHTIEGKKSIFSN